MTKTLKLEVSVGDIGEHGAIASTFATTEYVQTELNKKVNLTQDGKVDHTQLPDYTYISGLPEALEDEQQQREEAEANILSQAKTHTNQQLSEQLKGKADLVQGKVPFSQLPYSLNLEDNLAKEFAAVRSELKQTSDDIIEQIATLETSLKTYVDSIDTERKDYIDRAMSSFLEDLDQRYDSASKKLQSDVDAQILRSETRTSEIISATNDKVDAAIAQNNASTKNMIDESKKSINASIEENTAKTDKVIDRVKTDSMQALNNSKQGLFSRYDEEFSDLNDGYDLNSRLIKDDGSIVKNTVARNKTNPNDTTSSGWVDESNASSTPLGTAVLHNGSRSTIDVGYVAFDGQILNRKDHPAFWETVQRKFTVVSESVWMSDVSVRGCYSSGDGSTTFRMPDFNGVQTGSYKGAFLRGDGGGTIGDVNVSSGTALSDAIRNITGTVAGIQHINKSGGTGVFTELSTGVQTGISTVTSGNGVFDLTFDASRVVPVAGENRPVSIVGVWICRAGNAVAEAVSDPSKHAVLTGGNTFVGTQKMEAVEFNDGATLRGLVNDLTTGGMDKALTAEQGKILASKIAATGTPQALENKSFATFYVNENDFPITIYVTYTIRAGSVDLHVNGVAVGTASNSGSSNESHTLVARIPAKGSYISSGSGTISISSVRWQA